MFQLTELRCTSFCLIYLAHKSSLQSLQLCSARISRATLARKQTKTRNSNIQIELENGTFKFGIKHGSAAWYTYQRCVIGRGSTICCSHGFAAARFHGHGEHECLRPQSHQRIRGRPLPLACDQDSQARLQCQACEQRVCEARRRRRRRERPYDAAH